MPLHRLQRRELIALLGGAALAWPLAARAQESVRPRRVGVLMHAAANETDAQARLAAFVGGLQAAGWEIGRDLHVNTRWSRGDAARLSADAAELIRLRPDAVVAGAGATTKALQLASRKVPIVFAEGIDPIGGGCVESLARPGGNTTGFIATVLQATAQALGVELKPVTLADAGEIERALAAYARDPDCGLVVTASAASLAHHELIVALAAEHRLPAAYAYRSFAAAGGLISYGPEIPRLYRRAALYVNRILRGEQPGNLPVEPAPGYELVINLRTARSLSLEVPRALLMRADEAID